MSLLIMFERKHYTYEGASLAKTYNSPSVINEKTTMFNCLLMAMDSSYAIIDILSNKELRTNRLSPSSIRKWTIVKH